MLKRGGVKLSWPTGTSTTVANSFNVEAAVANIINSTSNKYYDNTFANPVIITFGEEMAFEGALALTGEFKLAPDAGYTTHRVCFEYGTAADASQALFLSASCSEELPSKYILKTAIIDNRMVLDIYPVGTIIYVR